MQALDEQEKGGKPGAKVARGATTGAANMNMAEFSGVSSSREHRIRENSCREHNGREHSNRDQSFREHGCLEHSCKDHSIKNTVAEHTVKHNGRVNTII